MYFWTPTKHFFRASNEDEYNIFFLILALKLKTRISPKHIELYLQIKKISFTFRPRSQQGHVLLWNKKLVPNLNLKRPLQWQLFIWFLYFGELVRRNKALSTISSYLSGHQDIKNSFSFLLASVVPWHWWVYSKSNSPYLSKYF